MNVANQLQKIRRQTLPLALERLLGSEYEDTRSGWPTFEIAKMTTNLDTQRVPLKASTRAERRGETPYYGASGVIDYVEGQTHDGIHLLVSEDGNNLASRRTAISFVAAGPIWANNHVHVLECSDLVLPEYVALCLNHLDLSPILTGTVQPKLTKAALAELRVPIPTREIQRSLVETADELEATWTDVSRTVETLNERLSATWAAILEDAFATVADYGRVNSDSIAERLGPLIAEIDEVPKESGFVPNREALVPNRPAASKPSKIRSRSARTIAEALSGRPEGLPPEELFQALSVTLGSSPDPIDTFYDMLKRAVAEGVVRELRDGPTVRVVGAL